MPDIVDLPTSPHLPVLQVFAKNTADVFGGTAFEGGTGQGSVAMPESMFSGEDEDRSLLVRFYATPVDLYQQTDANTPPNQAPPPLSGVVSLSFFHEDVGTSGFVDEESATTTLTPVTVQNLVEPVTITLPHVLAATETTKPPTSAVDPDTLPADTFLLQCAYWDPAAKRLKTDGCTCYFPSGIDAVCWWVERLSLRFSLFPMNLFFMLCARCPHRGQQD